MELVNTLKECLTECIRCSTACSEEEDAHLLSKCIKLTNNCADFCQLIINFLCRETEDLASLLEEFNSHCKACAIECAKHDHLEFCLDCAKACRKCMEFLQ